MDDIGSHCLYQLQVGEQGSSLYLEHLPTQQTTGHEEHYRHFCEDCYAAFEFTGACEIQTIKNAVGYSFTGVVAIDHGDVGMEDTFYELIHILVQILDD